MTTSMQSCSATRGARPQSLFYRDLSASPATRPSLSKGEPGQAAAAMALWRENFGGADPPPPPMYTLEDCIEHSSSTMVDESSICSPDPKFYYTKSSSRTPLSAFSNRTSVGITLADSRQMYTFGSPSLHSPQQHSSPGSPNWWSPLRERRGLDFGVGRDTEKNGDSPVSGVVQQQQQSGGLLTVPTLRELVRPELQYCETPPDTRAEGDEWVTIFGFGAGETNAVIREFEKCGTIVRHVPGPGGANWVHIQFQNRSDAQKAFQKNGMQINGALIVGVKQLDPLQRQILSEKNDRMGFMVLPLRTPGKGMPITSAKVSARPYYLQPNESAAGPIASPAKSTLSKIVDLVFGK